MLTKVRNIPHLNRIIYILVFSILLIFLGRDLLPFQGEMFSFHDNTQYVRVQQYSKQLKALEFPPKFAPDMNFGLGYPIFIFYAPLAYITSTLFNLLGLSVVESVRIAFLSFWIIGTIGMYFWMRSRGESQNSGIFASIVYASSPWWASEIFVRGNLATVSFLALAPWAFWAVHAWQKQSKLSLLAVSLVMLAHNALSLLFIPIIIGYCIFSSRKDRLPRIVFLLVSILTSSWFWIPSLFQLSSTYAQEVATMIKFQDHFLCLSQIWTTNFWGYGASMKGCNDGMSFMLGKPQIILFVTGALSAIFYFRKYLLTYFELLVVLTVVFMTTSDSLPIWQLFPFLQVIQFPWRLLALILPIVASSSGYAFNLIFDIFNSLTTKYFKSSPDKLVLELVIILILGIGLVILGSKFFVGQRIAVTEVNSRYLSKDYISNLATYEAPEYIPRTVNRDYWLQFRGMNIDPESRSILRAQMQKFSPNPIFQLIGFIITGVAGSYILWIHTKKTQS